VVVGSDRLGPYNSLLSYSTRMVFLSRIACYDLQFSFELFEFAKLVLERFSDPRVLQFSFELFVSLCSLVFSSPCFLLTILFWVIRSGHCLSSCLTSSTASSLTILFWVIPRGFEAKALDSWVAAYNSLLSYSGTWRLRGSVILLILQFSFELFTRWPSTYATWSS